jgi:hypothetical protein
MSWEYCWTDSLIALESATAFIAKSQSGAKRNHTFSGVCMAMQGKAAPAPRVAIVCLIFLPQPRLRRVSGLGVARCAGRPCGVHKLPRRRHHT